MFQIVRGQEPRGLSAACREEAAPAKTLSPDQKKALKELTEVEKKIDERKKELAQYEAQLAERRSTQRRDP